MRPSWQIDLKWAAGLAACLLVFASGVLFSLAHLTERDTAVPLATAITAIGVSERVSDEDYAQVRAAAAGAPDVPAALSPLGVTVTGGEIAGLDKEQAANLVSAKFAGVLYDQGTDAANTLITQPPQGSDKGAISLGPASALTSDQHSQFQTYFMIAAAVTLALLGAVVATSRGFGRLGAPAFVLAAGSAPLVLLWAAASSAAGGEGDGGNVFIQAARQAFAGAAGDLRTTFAIAFTSAAGAAVLSLVAGLATPLVRHVQRARSERAARAPEPPDLAPAMPEPRSVP